MGTKTLNCLTCLTFALDRTDVEAVGGALVRKEPLLFREHFFSCGSFVNLFGGRRNSGSRAEQLCRMVQVQLVCEYVRRKCPYVLRANEMI